MNNWEIILIIIIAILVQAFNIDLANNSVILLILLLALMANNNNHNNCCCNRNQTFTTFI
ncbi:MAG: hypothetical protein ACI4TX_02405 [Christensenellales bacterium]